MNANRCGVGRIADDRDHLAIAAGLAFGDQPLQQLSAEAAPVEKEQSSVQSQVTRAATSCAKPKRPMGILESMN